MRTIHAFAIVTASIGLATLVACQDDADNSTSTTSGPTSGTGASPATTGSGGMTSSTSAGGMTASSSSAGTGGNTGVPCTNDMTQLLISELATRPRDAEFIEIWNPSNAAVDLSNYYLSDNSIYYAIADGTAWAPGGTANTDFLVQFPPGTMIDGGAVLTVEFGEDFFGEWTVCPDFTVRTGVMCNGNPVPEMTVPALGGVGEPGRHLSDMGEMAILFCYDGGAQVYDVDYVNFDPDADPNTHVDKTNIGSYLDDTDEATQRNVAAPLLANGESLARADATENGETMTGGNGLLGHDETSETFDASFTVDTSPGPGVAP